MTVNITSPSYAKTIDLSADVTGTDYSVVGSAGARIRLNGHGHQISVTGALTLQFVDVYDLGDETNTSQSAINVTTTSHVTIENCDFESSNSSTFELDSPWDSISAMELLCFQHAHANWEAHHMRRQAATARCLSFISPAHRPDQMFSRATTLASAGWSWRT